MVEENSPLLEQENLSTFEKLKRRMSGKNATLITYLILVVIVGTANRVTFKIMQYSTINYSYFDSQITTFFYVPVNFAVIFFKIHVTKSITPEQRKFPLYKFAIMGLFDSLQGLFIVVGGAYVPGVMQNLLLQGVVPVTMMFSVLLLKPRGCAKCRRLRSQLKNQGVNFTEETTLPQTCEDESKCVARVVVDGMDIDVNNMNAALESMKGMNRHVVLYTSSKSWKGHVSTFYTIFQYLGAAIIMAGLVISVWPTLGGSSSSGGSFKWELLFFLATVPTAISGVYKELAFREADDMDVWYLNGWVALFQFLIGLTYAPLAAVMNDMAISDIPTNMADGFQCWLLGKNFIVPNVVNGTEACTYTDVWCGTTGHLTCCDSCNGMYPQVSGVPAFWGMLMYMTANIAYNVFLVLVIKYGSAALMYIASTMVLPLGSVAFTLKAFMGQRAMKFTSYDGAGLVVVLAGLIIYRFIGRKGASEDEPQPILVGVNIQEPLFINHAPTNPAMRPRTRVQLRNRYYSKLGLVPETSHEANMLVNY